MQCDNVLFAKFCLCSLHNAIDFQFRCQSQEREELLDDNDGQVISDHPGEENSHHYQSSPQINGVEKALEAKTFVPMWKKERTETKMKSFSAETGTAVREDDNAQTSDETKKVMSSTATLAVTSPRDAGQEGRPRRTLKVCTTSLTGRNSDSLTDGRWSDVALHTTTARTANSASSSRLPASSTPSKLSSLSQSDGIRSAMEVARSEFFLNTCPPAPPHHQASLPVKPPTSLSLQPGVSDCIDMSVRSPLTSDSPRSVSDILLSARSDTSGCSSARLPSPHQLSISRILELDMPETSIDDNTPKHAPASDLISDELSCTTDESGFTSASSEPENHAVPTGRFVL